MCSIPYLIAGNDSLCDIWWASMIGIAREGKVSYVGIRRYSSCFDFMRVDVYQRATKREKRGATPKVVKQG